MQKAAADMKIDYKKLGAIAVAVAAGLFFWSSSALYPLKLLAVLFHEAGHGLAAKIIGGSVESITIDRLEGGVCLMRYVPGLFNDIITSSAGYLGSALAGAAIVYVTLRRASGKLVLWILCVALAAVCVLWARSSLTVLVALGMSIAFGLGARYLSGGISQLIAFFIGVFVSLYALFDLKDDLWNAGRRAGTDAAILARATHIPSIIWAILWTIIGVGLPALAVYHGIRHGGVKSSGRSRGKFGAKSGRSSRA